MQYFVWLKVEMKANIVFKNEHIHSTHPASIMVVMNRQSVNCDTKNAI
jgi:hypothetical protein